MRANPRYKLPTEERLTKAALHYLDRYATTEANLRNVLRRKVLRACHALDEDPDQFDHIIDAVVAKCVRATLVDDRAYSEMKIASLYRKGTSHRKIQSYLAAKGVEREIVEAILTQTTSNEANIADRYARRRRLGPYGDPQKRTERRDRDLAAMCRAGHAFEISRQVIDADIGEDEDG